MLNPFSMYYGQACTGKEINDWCCYQIENNTLYYKEAVRLLKKKYRDDRTYYKSYKIIKTNANNLIVIEFM